jgi:HSP20 family protein
MALNRYHPFALRSPFDDAFFDTPFFAFPRELAFPRVTSLDQPEPQAEFWSHRHPYQVHEDDKAYTVSVDVPGVKAEDMNIKVEENILKLEGGRKVKSENGYSERKFSYSMTLGDDVNLDKISANLEDGVLKLTAPKMEVKKPAARVINITGGPQPMQIDVEKKKHVAEEKKSE